MGIKFAHALTYVLNQIDLSQLFHLARCNRDKINPDRNPCIDIDCSLVVCNIGAKNFNININNNAQYLVDFAMTFINIGFDVMLVFDGDVRHHSKRLTLQRASCCRRNQLNLVINKSKMMSLCNKLQSTDSVQEKNSILEQQNQIKKRITTLENALQHSRIDVGTNLYNATENLFCQEAIISTSGQASARDTS
jgi:hypothetical protein